MMRKIIFYLGVFLTAACGIDSSLTTTIKIDIDSLTHIKNTQRNSMREASTTELPPETASNFECYFVNIRGSGVRNFDPSQIQKVNSACLGFESISNLTEKDKLKTNGVTLTMPRSASSAHSVDVFGVSGIASGVSCSESLKQTTTQPKIYQIAHGDVGPLSADMMIPVSLTYNKNTAVDKNQFCQNADTEIYPIGYSWIDSASASAIPTRLYPASLSYDTTTPAVFDTGAALASPDFNATFTRLTPSTNIFTGQFSLSNYNLMGMDFLFDVSNADIDRIKSIKLTATGTISCKDATGTDTVCSSYYPEVNHLVVITPYQKTAGSWDCSRSTYTATNMAYNFDCRSTTTLTSALFSQYTYSREVSFSTAASAATATGTATTVTRNFIQASFRSLADNTHAPTATMTITNPKLTYGF